MRKRIALSALIAAIAALVTLGGNSTTAHATVSPLSAYADSPCC